jgi:5-methylcytosine-specific restriction endonuclease McrA
MSLEDDMLLENECPALLLNADYRPLSFVPLSLLPWQEAIKAVCQGKVDIVSEYDEVVHSPSVEMRLPSVVVLRDYQKTKRRVAFTRHHLALRDSFCCCYCGRTFPTKALTFDHVIPRSRGGKLGWLNTVCACFECNGRKANRTPEEAKMPLLLKPYVPTQEELNQKARKFLHRNLHKDWIDYVYWDTALDEE